MSDPVLIEISTALGDIVAYLDKGPGSEVQSALVEAATALGDLVSAIEGQKAVDLAALVAAVNGLKLAAPAINVQVNPTPIQNYMPPTQVVVQPAGNVVTRIVFKLDHRGNIETADLIRSAG